MRRYLLATLLCCAGLFQGAGSAQTVQPALVEVTVGKPSAFIDGHFDVTNDSLVPMAVVLEPKSFSIGRDGTARFRSLDAGVQLQLDVNSVRLAPRQRRTIYYRVKAAAYPVWFSVYANFMPLVHGPGVQMQLEMPHTVYLLPNAKLAPVAVSFLSLSRDGSVLHGVMQNRSATMVRVLSVQAVGAHAKQAGSGFPLLPGGEREFDLSVPEGPLRLVAQTAHFRVVQVVQ